MSKKQGFVVAWIEIKGERFEILVRPENAFRYKEGEKVDINDVLWSDIVYKDVKRGLKAGPESIKKAFGTEDVRVIAEKILKEGKIQLTEEERRKMLEAKRRKVISYIAKNAIDPKTKLPIPEQRIESAMEEAGISIDLYKDAESQAIEIVQRLARIMPIKIARALVEATVPAESASRVAGEARRLGDLKKSEWLKDGSLKIELEIPAGAQIEVINRLQEMAKGKAVINVRVA